jgi:hypothetical protein
MQKHEETPNCQTPFHDQNKGKLSNSGYDSENSRTTTERGRILEQLICYLFEKVPGISMTHTNAINVSGSEEIDVAFWNEKKSNGTYFLPDILLIECKNTLAPVGNEEVTYFCQKVKSRGLDFGILIATNGITGSSTELSRAHHTVSMFLSEGRKLIVINRQEIESLLTTKALIKLIKEKLCELTVTGAI